MLGEVIVCDKCQAEDCTVVELREKEKISMKAYAERERYPHDLFTKYVNQKRSSRRFLITCQECGHQLEYSEIIPNQSQVIWNAQEEMHND